MMHSGDNHFTITQQHIAEHFSCDILSGSITVHTHS